MKPTHITLNQGQIIAFEMPEKPEGYSTDYLLSKYAKLVEAAIKDGVAFKPDDNNVYAVMEYTLESAIEQGKHYPVPEEYEVKIEKKYVDLGSRERLMEYTVLVPKQEKGYPEIDLKPENLTPNLRDSMDQLCGIPTQISKQPTSIEEAAEKLFPFIDNPDMERTNRHIKTQRINWIAGVKSQEAKEYWFEKFKQEKK
jgi:hypothetical protein